ncbi:threonine aldolase [Caballeronia udeis]|uniref:Threonine aldolase n=1 Tax=Caballeronia udeis TaxID=1232866 RepID=A0A158GMK2_9BURK|nr:GntG family PLP-dependent aldolase [Caballeronia udeis]SAL33344.1 threonine aldolase [Caballeronia udeis]
MTGMIDLRSDTVTRPTDAMWAAMQEATLGDDTVEGDATVQALEQEAAALLGKEDALFVCSGTMGNVLATLVHANRGGEAVLDQHAHMANSEGGGVSRLAGLFCRTIASHRGEMDLDLLSDNVRGGYSRYGEPTAMVAIETSHNAAGGCVQGLDYFSRVAGIARERGAAVHLDGARLFNAAVALGVEAREIALHGDSVTFCLSKGLSAPMGSVLLGSREFIERARTLRRTIGGGLRQAGIMAAAGLVALRTMPAKLADDHRRTLMLWERLRENTRVETDRPAPQTNILRLAVPDGRAEDHARWLATRGVAVRASGRQAMRLVIHRHIDDTAIDTVSNAFEALPG